MADHVSSRQRRSSKSALVWLQAGVELVVTLFVTLPLDAESHGQWTRLGRRGRKEGG
jgi:hypothetical protein